MSELEHYIKTYFEIIKEEDLNKIVSLFEKKTLKKGEFLLKSGKICSNLSFVNAGLLRMYLTNEDKEITQWISTKGYFSTDLTSFIFNSPSKISIQALTDTEVYSISKTNYESIDKLVPDWHHIEKLFLVRCFITLEERILSHLSMSAEERYNYFFKNNREIFLPGTTAIYRFNAWHDTRNI